MNAIYDGQGKPYVIVGMTEPAFHLRERDDENAPVAKIGATDLRRLIADQHLLSPRPKGGS